MAFYTRSRGDLRTLFRQSFPARPGQGDGAGALQATSWTRLPHSEGKWGNLWEGLALRKRPLPEWAETGPLTGPCAALPGGSGRDGGQRYPWRRDGQGERLGAQGACRPEPRARSWAGVSSSIRTRSRTTRIRPETIGPPP